MAWAPSVDLSGYTHMQPSRSVVEQTALVPGISDYTHMQPPRSTDEQTAFVPGISDYTDMQPSRSTDEQTAFVPGISDYTHMQTPRNTVEQNALVPNISDYTHMQPPRSTVEQTALVPDIGVHKRKPSYMNTEATGSKKARHQDSDVEPDDTKAYFSPGRYQIATLPLAVSPLSTAVDPQTTTISSSASFSIVSASDVPEANKPASCGSTIENGSTLASIARPTPSNGPSRKVLNMTAHRRSFGLALSKLDDLQWASGVPLDKCISFGKDQLKALKSPHWYSTQVVLAWRASLAIPSNWIILTPEERVKSHPIPNGTTDIAEVVCYSNHWTLVHLSIEGLSVTYYDSFLTKDVQAKDYVNMMVNCNRLVEDVRSEHEKGEEITIPACPPSMSIRVS